MAASAPAASQSDAFHPGPVIPGFGNVANVEQDMEIPADAEFRVVFDVSTAADPGEINRTFASAARFLNMHAEAGVPEERIHLAIVIHGRAVRDVTRDPFYGAHTDGAENGSGAAVAELQRHGVRFYVCGQSAAYYGVANADLLPGVEMALSAMTAHALLQQQGYTLNPF
ncbi:DsrE family protein [Parasphingopyxis marina]|nr:DsrE family protein [Parasphingopyxis marina]